MNFGFLVKGTILRKKKLPYPWLTLLTSSCELSHFILHCASTSLWNNRNISDPVVYHVIRSFVIAWRTHVSVHCLQYIPHFPFPLFPFQHKLVLFTWCWRCFKHQNITQQTDLKYQHLQIFKLWLLRVTLNISSFLRRSSPRRWLTEATFCQLSCDIQHVASWLRAYRKLWKPHWKSWCYRCIVYCANNLINWACIDLKQQKKRGWRQSILVSLRYECGCDHWRAYSPAFE